MKQENSEPLDGKTYRQMVTNSTVERSDNLASKFGMLNEAVDGIQNGQETGPVQDREPEKDPILLRPILAILTIIAVISGCAGALSGLGGFISWRAWGVFALSGGPRLAYAYYKYRKEQRAWIARMNRQK